MTDTMTTISVWPLTKSRMDAVKLCPDESYDSLINRLLDERQQKKER